MLALIAKEVDLETAEVGDTLTYTLTVTNDSSVTATSVEVRDTVPAHTTLIAGSLSADARSTGPAPGSVVTWLTGQDLAPGASLVRTFQVTASEGGIATNTATVDSGGTSLTVSSNTVSTRIWEPVACGFQDGFEAGELSHHWRVTATEDGRARVLPDLPDSGSYSAVLDDAVSAGSYSLATMDLAADLLGETNVRLDFRWTEAGDETDSEDGVFMRQAEGDPWVSVFPFLDTTDLVFQSGAIDLDQAAANAALTLVDGFQLRFQFYDNFSFNPGNLGGSDGYWIVADHNGVMRPAYSYLSLSFVFHRESLHQRLQRCQVKCRQRVAVIKVDLLARRVFAQAADFALRRIKIGELHDFSAIDFHTIEMVMLTVAPAP